MARFSCISDSKRQSSLDSVSRHKLDLQMADDSGFVLFVANVPQCTPEELTRHFEDAGVRVQHAGM